MRIKCGDVTMLIYHCLGLKGVKEMERNIKIASSWIFPIIYHGYQAMTSHIIIDEPSTPHEG